MSIKMLCEKCNLTQTGLAKRFGIPLRTVQDWYAGRRNPPDYVVNMMIEILAHDCAEKSPVVQKAIETRRKEVFSTRYIPEGTEVKSEDFRKKT